MVVDKKIGDVSNGDNATDNKAGEGPFFRVLHIFVKVLSVSIFWIRLLSYEKKIFILLKFSIALFLKTIAAIDNGQKQQRHVSHIRNADGSSASKILSEVYPMLEIHDLLEDHKKLYHKKVISSKYPVDR